MAPARWRSGHGFRSDARQGESKVASSFPPPRPADSPATCLHRRTWPGHAWRSPGSAGRQGTSGGLRTALRWVSFPLVQILPLFPSPNEEFTHFSNCEYPEQSRCPNKELSPLVYTFMQALQAEAYSECDPPHNDTNTPSPILRKQQDEADRNRPEPKELPPNRCVTRLIA